MDFSNRKKKRAAAITTPSVGFLIQKVCWPSEIRCELSFSVTAQEGTLSALNDILTANPFQRFVFVVFCRLSSSSILFFFLIINIFISYIFTVASCTQHREYVTYTCFVYYNFSVRHIYTRIRVLYVENTTFFVFVNLDAGSNMTFFASATILY